MMSNAKFLPEEQMLMIRQRLEKADDERFAMLSTVQLKDPTTALIISLFGGGLGIDRFYIGDTGLGIAKLLTLGGCGLWSLIDLFLISKATRKKNFAKVMPLL